MYNLSFDTSVRVWDAFWLRKFDFIYSVGISIMKLCKGKKKKEQIFFFVTLFLKVFFFLFR